MQRWQNVNNWSIWMRGIQMFIILLLNFSVGEEKRKQERSFSSFYIREKESQESQKLKFYVTIQ